MSEDDNDDLNSKIVVLLIGVGSAAIVATIYHCLAMTWCCHRYRARPNTQEPPPYVNETSLENSTGQLIPSYKYRKGMGLTGENGTCAICLSDFEESEELRTLPECLHSFHVACIDMWLYSHSNCPMCRTDATPSPQIFLNATDLDSERSSQAYRTVGVLRGIVVH